MNRQQAIEMAESKWWENEDDETIFLTQLLCEKVIMDWTDFKRITEKVLGRPVYTHEYAFPENLLSEHYGLKNKPDLKEIMDLIPKDKIIIPVFKD